MKNNLQTKKISNRSYGSKLKVPYIQQINKNACGAAVLEMIYKYYGIKNITQSDIFNKYKEPEPHGTGNNRISTDDLVRDASGQGFLSFWARADYNNKETSFNLLRRLTMESKIPVIVCQKFTNKEPLIGHFRIVVGIKDNNIVYVHDPHVEKGGGFKEWSIDHFMEFWKPTGKNVTGGVFIVIKKL